MCGIIGIIGKDHVANHLVDGLKRLEYRGYDSAGIATIHTNPTHGATVGYPHVGEQLEESQDGAQARC